MEDEKISTKAKKVIELFFALFDLAPAAGQDSVPGLVEFDDQLGRFKIWGANIGVFAEQHASLDYRLRGDHEATVLMKSLLDGLQRNVRQAIREFGFDEDSSESQLIQLSMHDGSQSDAQYSLPSSYASSEGLVESVAESDPLSQTEVCVHEIELIIDTLYRLSTSIRKPSSRRQNTKAAMYRIKDEEGNDCDAAFLEYALRRVQHLFPGVGENLAHRLADTIRLRRRMFLYRQQHQVKLQYRPPVDVLKEEKVGRRPVASTIARTRPQGSRGPLIAFPPSITSASALSRAIHLPSAIGAQSVISRTVAPESSYDIPMQVPRPPRASPGSKEVECPYCCLIMPIKETKQAEWRNHFLRDLEPFVCTFDPCPDAKQLYTDQRTWLSHMEQVHGCQQWACSAPGHNVFYFETDAGYEQHMWQSHPGTFAENHLQLMKKRAMRAAPVFTSCPLCGLEPADLDPSRGPTRTPPPAISPQASLSKHVASHLRSLALISLPWDGFEGEEDAGKSEATVSRNTILSDSDLPPAAFDGRETDVIISTESLFVDEEAMAEQRAERSPSDDVLTREWGFVEYPSDYGHDRDPILQPFLRKVYIESFPYLPNQSRIVLPCYVNPFPRNANFFGREKALEEMSRMLCPSIIASTPDLSCGLHTNPRTYAVHGPGGMGKSQVAIEFVYRYRHEFDAVFWVNANDKTSLDQDFNKIALQLGLVPEGSTNARDFKYTRELVKRWLLDPFNGVSDHRAEADQVSWLLIYDGVDESRIINEFWPYDAPGSVLITSRSPFSWTKSWALMPFSGDEATNFLLQLTGKEWDEDSRLEVSNVNHKLGGLPLALTQMASLIKHREMSFAQFIRAYNEREKRQELLSANPDKSGRPSQYGHNLASVWALEHLSAQSAALLETLSFFHPDGISDRLYTENIERVRFAGFPESLPEYERARSQLLGSSVISRNKARSNLFIHRIVQDVARGRLTKDRLRDTFMVCVQLISNLWPFEVFPSWRHGVERWETCEEFFPHLLRMSELSDSIVPSAHDFEGDYRFIRILTDAGWYRHERGRSDESERFNNLAQRLCEVWQERLLALKSRAAVEDDNLRSVRDTIAEILHNRGCTASEINAPEVAFRYFQEFNSMLVRDYDNIPSLFENDMRLAISWNELGNAYMLKREWVRGEECFQRSIETMRRLKKFRDIDLSLPLVNMGLSYWLQGRNDEALEVLEMGLRTRQEAYGDEDRNSFTRGRYLHALGNVRGSMGAQDDSLAYHRDALHHYKATLGFNHHRTADLYVKVTQHSILMNQDETALVLIDHALRAYSDTDIYAPEKARALFLRSKILGMMRQPDRAGADLDGAVKLYRDITGTTVGDDSMARKLPTMAEFDTLIAFWSR